MSDITRWKASGPIPRLQPDANGPWVALVDYYRVIDSLIAERGEAQAEVERLKEQVAALTVAVEQADEMKAHAEAAAAAEEAETDRVMSERDAAQVEVERLKNAIDHLTSERNAAQAEVERLRANGRAILDSSRPTDEEIWREGFMRCLNDVAAEDWRAQADLVLTTYRERWPR